MYQTIQKSGFGGRFAPNEVWALAFVVHFQRLHKTT